MKNLVLSFVLAGVLIFGCSCDDSIVGPDSQDMDISPEMSIANENENLDIALPSFHKKDKKGNKDTGLSVTGLIEAKKSSELVMDSYYEADSDGQDHGKKDKHDKKDKKDKKGKKGKHGDRVEVYAKIDYPANSVDEDVTITMTFNPETGVFTFGPSMVFNKDAKLTVKLKGLDLEGVDKKDVDFVYHRLDGTVEYVKHSNISINEKKGELKVENIKIRHFSRFGFVRS